MSSEFVQLQWNAHHSALLQSLSSLRDKQVYTDVTLSCGGQFYPAHRLVLSSCSTFLAQALEVATSTAPVILLHGISQPTLEHLLLFMYDGQVTVAREELPGLLKAAQWLGVKGLESTYDNVGEDMAQMVSTIKTLLSSVGDQCSENTVESIMDLMVQIMQKTQATTDSGGCKGSVGNTPPTQKNKDAPLLKISDCCSHGKQETGGTVPPEKNCTDGLQLSEKNTSTDPMDEEAAELSAESCCRQSTSSGGSELGMEGGEEGCVPTTPEKAMEEVEEERSVTTTQEKATEEETDSRGRTGEAGSQDQEDITTGPTGDKEKGNVKSLNNSKRGLRCRHCRKFFLVRAELAKHMRMLHVDFFHNLCHICNISFLTTREYNAHLKLHRIGQQCHQCDECIFVTNNKRSLLKHQLTVHPAASTLTPAHLDKPQCSQEKDILPSQVQPESSLVQEMMLPQVRVERLNDSRINLKLKKVQPFKDDTEEIICSTCGQKCKGKKDYEAHKLVSCYKIKLYKSFYHCPMCSYVGKRKQTVIDHICLTHTRKLRFECSLCTFTAKRKIVIKKHMAKHHGVLMTTP